MSNLDRNLTILLHIKGYCKEIFNTLEIINNNYGKYEESFIVKNSLCMDLLQIGELVNRLDSNYLEETKNEINWNQIRGMRNRLTHDYLKIDYDIVFNVVENDIPELDDFLTKELKERYNLLLEEQNNNTEDNDEEEI